VSVAEHRRHLPFNWMNGRVKFRKAMTSRLIGNLSHQMRSWLNGRSDRGLKGFIALLVALMSVSIAPALAQQSSPAQPDEIALHGMVRDSTGKPVGNALVRLEQNGSSTAVATTNSKGLFVFPAVRAGSCVISAQKSGLRSRAVTVPAVKDGKESYIDLVLELSDDPKSASSTEAMAFADRPNFTVAGITDWTAVGGHGSDASLRTSEALARETTTLKPGDNTLGATRPASASASSETETMLRTAVAHEPGSFEANHQLGEFCFHKGSYREAIPPLEAAYQIDPANHRNEYDLALAYKETGEYSRAREHIQKLIAEEDNADLHRVLGELDEEAGDSLAAVHEDEEAASLDPSEQNYFAWGSELLLHRAVWPAVEVFRKGSEAHPKSARMLAALGAALFASANYSEAAARLCEASDLSPADPAPYIFLGKIDMAAPEPLPCIESKLARYNQEQPGDARAKYYYAMAIWKRLKASENTPNAEQVEKLLTEAVMLDPKYDAAYLQLGNIYSDERNFEKAIGFYLRAIEANSQLSDAHYRLGVAYERISEPAKAKQEFQLHDEIEKAQAAAVERQRQEVKQFMVVLQGQPVVTNPVQ
jgi:tetratricopeptide (TPR) repeat protein